MVLKTMVYGTYNELVTGAFVNQLTTGGPHIAQCSWVNYCNFSKNNLDLLQEVKTYISYTSRFPKWCISHWGNTKSSTQQIQDKDFLR